RPLVIWERGDGIVRDHGIRREHETGGPRFESGPAVSLLGSKLRFRRGDHRKRLLPVEGRSSKSCRFVGGLFHLLYFPDEEIQRPDYHGSGKGLRLGSDFVNAQPAFGIEAESGSGQDAESSRELFRQEVKMRRPLELRQ